MIYNEILDAPGYFIDGTQILPIDLIPNETEKASTEEREKRMMVCLSCEKNKPVNCCSECGCWVSAKTWVKNTTCPLGKW